MEIFNKYESLLKETFAFYQFHALEEGGKEESGLLTKQKLSICTSLSLFF